MKKIYFLSIAVCVLNVANVMAGIRSSTELKTDTIYKLITDFQSDSLIKANCSNPCFYILDVRTPTEFNSGHLLLSNNIDFRATDFSDKISNLDRNIIYLVYCKGGSRSLPTYNQMITLHFRGVYMMAGGFDQWKLDGLPYQTSIVSNIEKSIAPEKTLNFYPNPANEYITLEIKIPINKTSLSILNTKGQELIKQQITTTQFKIDVSQLPNGVYFVKLMNAKGIEVGKFVKD